MTLTYENIVDTLVQQVPELLPALKEHLRDNGELLRHVFFGDVTRYIKTLYDDSQKKDPDAPKILHKILQLLEQAIKSSDLKLQNLIFVSFLENLELKTEDGEDFLNLLGPSLQKAWIELHA